jgi:hypothetical protein
MRGICLIVATLLILPSKGRGNEETASGPASRFPDPLGAQATTPGTAAPVSPNREQAARAYLRGRDLAEQKSDFAAAHRSFRQAISLEMSSTSLYAVAVCKRALNRPVDALFTFARTLYEDNRMPPSDRLPERFTRLAKESMNDLLGRFVPVRVVLPRGIDLEQMSFDKVPVMSTNLFGQANGNRLMAGVRVDWVPRPPFSFADDFVVYVQPGVRDIDFVLRDGRRLLIEKRRIPNSNHQIDLTREALPAKLVVENIQPGTHVVFTRGDDVTILDRKYSQHKRALSIGGLKQGEYTLEATRSGFGELFASYRLLEGQKERVVLDLKPRPLVKSWKLWLGVGLVATAAIVTTAVVLANRDKDDPPKSGTGVVTVSLFDR